MNGKKDNRKCEVETLARDIRAIEGVLSVRLFVRENKLQSEDTGSSPSQHIFVIRISFCRFEIQKRQRRRKMSSMALQSIKVLRIIDTYLIFILSIIVNDLLWIFSTWLVHSTIGEEYNLYISIEKIQTVIYVHY